MKSEKKFMTVWVVDKNMADDIVGSFLNDTIYIFNIKNFKYPKCFM